MSKIDPDREPETSSDSESEDEKKSILHGRAKRVKMRHRTVIVMRLYQRNLLIDVFRDKVNYSGKELIA